MRKIPQQLLGQSPAWLATLDRISELAALNRPILLVGERGTGKALAAARLHFLSANWEGAYKRINVLEYDPDELSSILFGDDEGFGHNEGVLGELAGGTLFIDHVDALPGQVQSRLLRQLEMGLSGQEDEERPVRILGATDVDLHIPVSEGRFHANLLEVLAFEVLSLPPLRARKGDVSLLAHDFAGKMAKSLGCAGLAGFTPEAMLALEKYPWPGNIRELKTVVERSVARAWNDEIDLASLPVSNIAFDVFASPWPLASGHKLAPDSISTPVLETRPRPGAPVEVPKTGSTDFTARVNAFERGLIEEALQANKNHQGKAAKYLGLTYHQFRGMLRKHGIKR